MTSILIVEDDENLRVVLHDNLEEEGYQVAVAENGSIATRLVQGHSFDLIILDIMLPDADGYSLCRAWRKEGVLSKILMLTARSLEDDLVRGLDDGADDYLVKPYRLRELLARVRALLRRSEKRLEQTLHCGDYAIDTSSHEVRHASGALVDLTPTEFDLLCHLVLHQGQALTRAEILKAVWDANVVVDDRTVDNFVSSLKRKLRWSQTSAFRICTVRGVGYRMDIDPLGQGERGTK